MLQARAALSVDVEFFSHTPAYRSAVGTTDQTAVGLEGIGFLLDAFDDVGGTGTFFTVSEIAESHPDTVATIATQHELGSHTHTHRHLSELKPAERRTELADSKRSLETTSGEPVVGFRAPSFDFTEDHFELLADTGYTYDSSIIPCRSIPGWYGGQYEFQQPIPASSVSARAPKTLAEVPVAVMPGLRLPLTGTWLRFFGVRYTLLGMKQLARRGITPVLYVHPWELVELPTVEGVPSRVYWRTGDYMRRAVRRILNTGFEFVPVGQLAEESETEPNHETIGRGNDR